MDSSETFSLSFRESKQWRPIQEAEEALPAAPASTDDHYNHHNHDNHNYDHETTNNHTETVSRSYRSETDSS